MVDINQIQILIRLLFHRPPPRYPGLGGGVGILETDDATDARLG